MARQPNQTDAKGIWDVTRPNQQRNAAYGEEWPLPAVPPPDYVQGYVSRFTGWNSGNLSTYPANNMVNTNSVYPQTNQFDAVVWRCTSHDWTLENVQMGHGRNVGGTFYFRVSVWAGFNVNSGTMLIDSGNQSMSMGYNSGVTNSVMLPTAPAWGQSTLKLTQNTYYTIAIQYWNNAVAQPGYYYSGNGYGSYISNPSATISTTGAGGTTTITSNWTVQAFGGGNSGVWSTGSITANGYNGPIGLLQVKVHQ